MAKNSQSREEARLQNAQRRKEQAYRAELKKLDPHPYVAAGLLIAALMLFFVNWMEIYNVDIPGVEISVSGFSAAICGITGTYTMPEGIYGMMAAFYYWAPEQCGPVGITALIALCAVVVSLVLLIVAGLKKKHALDAPAAVLALVSCVMMVMGFVFAKAMTEPLISGYCSGNPACSVRSYALIPAALALVAAAVSGIAAVKYFGARRKLQ